MKGPSQPGVFPHRRGVTISGYNRSVMSHDRGDTELAYIQGPGEGLGGWEGTGRDRDSGWMQNYLVKPS